MRRQAKAWMDSARDDLGVVEEIIDREDLTHMAAFHCQQAIEKSFKAVLEEYEQTVPRIHDLITLLNKVEKYVRLMVKVDLLNQLNELYMRQSDEPDIPPISDCSQEAHHCATPAGPGSGDVLFRSKDM